MDTKIADVLPTVEKDGEVWLEDGNIVLVASRRIAFRLYRGLLSCHSQIYEDMFSVAHPGVCREDVVDGCPVVHVPDQPDILRLFLLILVRSGFGTPRWPKHSMPQTLRFCDFAALVRIAHKYQARTTLHLLVESSALLETVSAQVLNDLPNLKDGSITVQLCNIPIALVITTTDAIEIVNLARFLCIEDKASLAGLFMMCCIAAGTRPLYLRDGTVRADGILERLSDADFARCIVALPRLYVRCRNSVLHAASTETPTTDLSMIFQAERDGFTLRRSMDFFRCDSLWPLLLARHELVLEKLKAELPVIFGL
ncbi:hypothetical protein PYCCODRAFT_1527089 [Trametes coccinea BRFM310]|uniref:BTB domain-containing protein n=1 Tax=Trametes coccinea (strain BRFM310) TaxID=1353009 RepID=A0A1Y2I9V1_TRAC3|nr:hypothetical protein PYCCODRAFT_1527089 [Trametes coccinea BRFM310]